MIKIRTNFKSKYWLDDHSLHQGWYRVVGTPSNQKDVLNTVLFVPPNGILCDNFVAVAIANKENSLSFWSKTQGFELEQIDCPYIEVSL